MNNLKIKKENKKKYCVVCGKELVRGQKKFCSIKCSTSYLNEKRKKPNSNFGKEFVCRNCGKLCKANSSTHKMLFCSIKCQQNYYYRENIRLWKEGKTDGLKGKYGIANYIKRYFIEKYNNKCQLCGWGELNPYTNKVPLEIHHIDGNYLNNKEENLQILCPNCHSLTNTYRSLNKNGRKERNKYTL